ncbi:uncharacterized protein LOC144057307 isoform X1 [Vanacampus margaritifer]
MLLILIFLSLFFSPVLLLSCYVCSSSLSNDECNASTQQCREPLDTCMTAVDTLGTNPMDRSGRRHQKSMTISYSSFVCCAGHMKAIVKQCASRATCNGAASAAFVDSDGNGNAVSCCNSFSLCNFSGVGSVRARGRGAMLLLVAAGTLLWSD